MLTKRCFFDEFWSSVNVVLQPFLILSIRSCSRLETFLRLPLEGMKIYLRQAPSPPDSGVSLTLSENSGCTGALSRCKFYVCNRSLRSVTEASL